MSDTLYNHMMWFWFCFGMADENGPYTSSSEYDRGERVPMTGDKGMFA